MGGDGEVKGKGERIRSVEGKKDRLPWESEKRHITPDERGAPMGRKTNLLEKRDDRSSVKYPSLHRKKKRMKRSFRK